MLGRKKAEKNADERRRETQQAYIRESVFGKNPSAAQAAGDQAQAALAEHQALVNPENKSKRSKRK